MQIEKTRYNNTQSICMGPTGNCIFTHPQIGLSSLSNVNPQPDISFLTTSFQVRINIPLLLVPTSAGVRTVMLQSHMNQWELSLYISIQSTILKQSNSFLISIFYNMVQSGCLSAHVIFLSFVPLLFSAFDKRKEVLLSTSGSLDPV